jgi:hypothetical protein
MGGFQGHQLIPEAMQGEWRVSRWAPDKSGKVQGRKRAVHGLKTGWNAVLPLARAHIGLHQLW